MSEIDWLAEQFEHHRSHLRAVAYRMLGSVAEAEDAVQEAWIRRRPSGHARGREPWRLAHHRGGACVPERSAVAHDSPRRAARRPRARPDRHARQWHRPRAGGAARGLGRPRAPRGPRDIAAGRAHGVRAARHVRGVVRRDRDDRRQVTFGCSAAGEPRPAPGARHRAGPGPGPRPPASCGRRLLRRRPQRRVRGSHRAARPGHRAARRLRSVRRVRRRPRCPCGGQPSHDVRRPDSRTHARRS